MNWFDEGVLAAQCYMGETLAEPDAEIPEPKCPWPIYTPEGIEWLRGWNSISDHTSGGVHQDIVLQRPVGHGSLFAPTDADLDRAEALL